MGASIYAGADTFCEPGVFQLFFVIIFTRTSSREFCRYSHRPENFYARRLFELNGLGFIFSEITAAAAAAGLFVCLAMRRGQVVPVKYSVKKRIKRFGGTPLFLVFW
jgi:hypothetical protein